MNIDPIMTEAIVTPPGWSVEKDQEAFHERWGPHPAPVAFVLKKISESYHELSELLTSATSFYMMATGVSWHAAECMSFGEKVHWVETFVLSNDVCATYRERICADLKVCRWVDAERCRVLDSYLAENGSGWIYPLLRLSDRLTTALTDLEQTLKAEADEFTHFQTRRVLQESSNTFSTGAVGPEQNGYERFHERLDQVVIGISAQDEQGSIICFDGSSLVWDSEEAMRKYLKRIGLGMPSQVYESTYGRIRESMHIEGIDFLMEAGAFSLFSQAREQDLRIVLKTQSFSSEIGTLVEPTYNPHRDPIKLLEAQVSAAQVGVYAECVTDPKKKLYMDWSTMVLVFGTEAALRSSSAWKRHEGPWTVKSLHFDHLADFNLLHLDTVALHRLAELEQLSWWCKEPAEMESDEE